MSARTALVCIHGHFYQPPRENPGLETVEREESAAPWHDWNERITAECYEPNTEARILDDEGRIARIVNNWSKIAFDAGPTLLSWLERSRPVVYRAILAADRESASRHGGHGNAIAQAFHHAILPLCSSRDKRTQVAWGARDFELRFSRPTEGMWLPETAVDLETLDVLVDHGIRFTVLAPRQARRVRESQGAAWIDVGAKPLDTRRPYHVRLPSGRTIAVFFYDGATSQAIAFEDLLASGARFEKRLHDAFSKLPRGPELVSGARDGEAFWHPHHFGGIARAGARDASQRGERARLVNWGEALALFPATAEVELVESSSWSCAHGVDRWKGGCDCGVDPVHGAPWRQPLRDALEFLRDQIAHPFEEAAGRLLTDPWAARDAYVDVIVHRSPETIDAFFAAHARGPLSAAERTRALKLMEMQRHALHMFTSCGWFFADVAGREGQLVLGFADRVIELGEELFGQDLGAEFRARLARAKSADAEIGDARTLYDSKVRTRRADAARVAMNAAIGALFDEDATRELPAFTVATSAVARETNGRATLATGRLSVVSRVTLDRSEFAFAAAHLGGHRVSAGVVPVAPVALVPADPDPAFGDALLATFRSGDFPAFLKEIDRALPGAVHSLRALLDDDRLRVVERILERTVAGIESELLRIHEDQRPLLRFLSDLAMPVPRALRVAAEFALGRELREALDARPAEVERVKSLLHVSRAENVALDARDLSFAFDRAVERVVARAAERVDNLELLLRLEQLVRVGSEFPFGVDLRRVQNLCFHLITDHLATARDRARRGDVDAAEFAARVTELSRLVRVRVPAEVPEPSR